jgi:methylglutaconyl-CoA hydratase
MPLATLDIHGRVARLTLNRPEQRNALNSDLLDELSAHADSLAKTPGLAVTVLTGAGRAFCAGMDLKQVLGNPAAAERLLTTLAEFTLNLRALPCVTLAVVNGAAIGGGCGLTTVCDVAITHADSKMGFPEVDLGVCPAVVAPWLCKKIGVGAARRVLLMGGLLSGREAHAAGIVSHLVEAREELDTAAEALVTRLAAGAPRALAATKSLLNELDGSLDAPTLRKAATLSASVLSTPESQAMLRAKLGQ